MKTELLGIKLGVKLDFRGVKKRRGRWKEKSSKRHFNSKLHIGMKIYISVLIGPRPMLAALTKN
jgi:hypothetical protein